MGANFQTMKTASHDKAAAKAEFEKAQDQDRYENGHSYSGGFGMATGLDFVSAPTFTDEDAAYEWLDENCVKWENAKAVTLNEGNDLCWFIGAVCAS